MQVLRVRWFVHCSLPSIDPGIVPSQAIPPQTQKLQGHLHMQEAHGEGTPTLHGLGPKVRSFPLIPVRV